MSDACAQQQAALARSQTSYTCARQVSDACGREGRPEIYGWSAGLTTATLLTSLACSSSS